MSETITPTSILENQFGRLLDQLENVWGYPEQFENVINKVMLDDRGDRAGFPIEVWNELNFLQSLHRKVYIKTTQDPTAARRGRNF